MSSTITASNSQQTPTSESTTGFYATSDITTDDSTSVYNTTTQNVLSSSTKPTTVYTSTSNAATAQTIVSNSSETAMSLSSGTSQGSFPAGGNVNVTATMVPIQVVAKNHSRTTSSSRLVSSTTRTNGKHPQSVRASTSPLNHAKVHTGVSQTPVVVPASLSTIGNTAQIGCGAPPSIDGAKMISNGPYRAGTYAFYTCISGYTMTGTASRLCGNDLKWSQPVPQCIGTSRHTGLEEELTGMPLWLAIIVGVAVSVICLILMTYLLIMCLRMFGCWKGSFFGGSTRLPSYQVYPEKTPPGVTRATSAMIVNEKKINGNTMSQVENGRQPDSHRLPPQLANTYTVNGTKIYTGQMKSSQLSPPLINVNYDSRNPRRDIPNTQRQAKMPKGRQWMPHSHGVRNFNTSTK